VKKKISQLYILRCPYGRRREVEYAFDIRLDELVRNFLRLLGRRRYDPDLYIAGAYDFLETVDVEDLHRFADTLRNTPDDHLGIEIEGGDDLIILLQEILVYEEGAPHVSDTYNGYTPFPVYAQYLFNMSLQVFDIVTHTANSEFTEIGEILSHLSSVDVADACDHRARRDLFVLALQIDHTFQVAGKPAYRRFGNL